MKLLKVTTGKLDIWIKVEEQNSGDVSHRPSVMGEGVWTGLKVHMEKGFKTRLKQK